MGKPVGLQFGQMVSKFPYSEISFGTGAYYLQKSLPFTKNFAGKVTSSKQRLCTCDILGTFVCRSGVWDAISFKSGMSSRLVIEKTITMVEIVNWWLRMTIVLVEIIDWWLRMTIAMVQKTIEYWEHDRYGRKKDWWWKMMIERIENIEWRLVIENVDRWDWKYKLAIESWKGLETSGDQLWDNTLLLTSSSKAIFAPFWRKTWRLNGDTSSDEGKRILEKLQQKASELSTPLGNNVAK